MKKFILFLFLIVLFSAQSYAQFADFPTGMNGIPISRLKGSVHNILTIQQRGEHVFDTEVEIYNTEGKIIEKVSSNVSTEVHKGWMNTYRVITYYSDHNAKAPN